MAFEDLYRTLLDTRSPHDLGEASVHEADECVYRIAFTSIPLAGIPSTMRIDGVEVYRVVGPLLTQHTDIRQRHGLPIVFDKTMHRGVEIGHNAVLTVCQIRESVPDRPSAWIAAKRDRALAVVGILASILDDRLAIEEVLEDMIFMAQGVPVVPGDVRLRLRTFLPFDVSDEERGSIAELTTVDLDRMEQVSQAARWYIRAAQQGPVVDSIVLFWLAIEALTPHPTTSPKTVEALLLSAGFDPGILDISVGKLAGLRADIVHDGKWDPELVRAGYYRLEAVVRVLLRDAIGASSSWPPVLTPGVFGECAADIDRQAGPERRVVWHDASLPPPPQPRPAGLGWSRLQEPPLPPWLRITEDIQPSWRSRVSYWLVRARQALDVVVDPQLEVLVGPPPGASPDVEIACNAQWISIRPELLTHPDPVREIRLALRLTEALAQVILMRTGLQSVAIGIGLIEIAGAWAGYRTFYGPDGPLTEDELVINSKDANDLHTWGGLLGTALAGSAKANAALTQWSSSSAALPELVEVTGTLLRKWADIASYQDLLARLDYAARALHGTQDKVVPGT